MLRKQLSLMTKVLVFMHTSPHRAGPQLSLSVVISLCRPTDETLALALAASYGMRSMCLLGCLFIKAGVILVDLLRVALLQGELDLEDGQPYAFKRDRSRLMVAMDAINGRYGKGTVGLAATGRTRPQRLWEMKQERKMPRRRLGWGMTRSHGLDRKRTRRFDEFKSVTQPRCFRQSSVPR